MLLRVLEYNENTSNKVGQTDRSLLKKQFSDASYLAGVVTAIGNALSAVSDREERDQTDVREAIEAIDRVMIMDRLAPSYHNMITEAGLRVSSLRCHRANPKAQMKFVLAGHRTNDPRLFLSYTR